MCSDLLKVQNQPMFLKEIAREQPDIKEALTEIPWELVLGVNRIAAEIASVRGWKCEPGYDFLGSTNPRAIEMCRLAITGITALQEFCMDEWGTSLDDLVITEEK